MTIWAAGKKAIHTVARVDGPLDVRIKEKRNSSIRRV